MDVNPSSYHRNLNYYNNYENYLFHIRNICIGKKGITKTQIAIMYVLHFFN